MNRQISKKLFRLILTIIAVVFLAALAIIFVFRYPVYIEAKGIIDSYEKRAVFSTFEGYITLSELIEGNHVEQGQLILEGDYRLTQIALERTEDSLKALEKSQSIFKEKKEIWQQIQTINTSKNAQEIADAWRLLNVKGITQKEFNDLSVNSRIYDMNNVAESLSFAEQENEIQKALSSLKADYEHLKIQKELFSINAPISGTIIIPQGIDTKNREYGFFSIKPEKGIYVYDGQLMAYVASDSDIGAKLQVPEKDAVKLKIGQEVVMQLGVLSSKGFYSIHGTVSWIGIHSEKGFFSVFVDVDDKEYSKYEKQYGKGLSKYFGSQVDAKIKAESGNLFTILVSQ